MCVCVCVCMCVCVCVCVCECVYACVHTCLLWLCVAFKHVSSYHGDSCCSMGPNGRT